jgi:hypothetical protein
MYKLTGEKSAKPLDNHKKRGMIWQAMKNFLKNCGLFTIIQ